jgi:hypothetical protein
MTDPMEALRTIREKLAEVTEPLGLELREMDVRVAPDGRHADTVIAIFTIDVEQIGKTEDEVAVDAQIAEMEQQMLQQTRDTREEEARANLDALFKKYRKE